LQKAAEKAWMAALQERKQADFIYDFSFFCFM